MKNKHLLLALIIMVSFTFASCSNGGDISTITTTEQETTKLTREIPEGKYTDTGKGTFVICFPAGNSENGNIPVEYVHSYSLAGEEMEDNIYVAYDANDFDATMLTKLYVDGVLHETEQIGNISGGFYVYAGLTVPGIHTVEALQLDENGNVVTYKSAQYEIKVIEE